MTTEQESETPPSRLEQLKTWQAEKEKAKPGCKGRSTPSDESRRTNRIGKAKSSSKSSGRRKKSESLKVTDKTPKRTTTKPKSGDDHASGKNRGTDARPKGSSSSTKIKHETLPQDRSSYDERMQDEEYKGDPVMSPEPFQLFSPPTTSKKGADRAKSPAVAGIESTGDILNLVREEIDRLAQGIDSIGEPPELTRQADTHGDGAGNSEPSELRPSDFTDRIERSLEIMGRRADMMAEALERNYARTEALEKENKVLREMLQRLVKAEHKDFMAEMLTTVNTMKTALSSQAATMQDSGTETVTIDGGITTGLDGDTVDVLSGVDTLLANADVQLPESSASPNETAGIKFVTDLAEVMSIQTGHHGLLAGIMDRRLAMEAEADGVDVSEDRPS